ncbi:MAG: carbohydrate ABC transporter permease [Anaerolineae bacterium]|nr:carbohydrate ABC transporter permease [Caldilineales bacterium]MCX7851302.1 carbohydrate ABC transporter permease [Caldilineales bacterium]MDW8269955.1 carbohydrate ABC transporter permease [Anaerolineae bacterium]
MAATGATLRTRQLTSEQALRLQRIRRGVLYTVLIVLGLLSLTPFILAFLGTFKTDAEIIAYPPTLLPEQWLWQNWVKTWNTDLGEGATFPRWLLNTAVIAIGSALLQVVFCSMAGYAFARLDFPGKNIVFSFMLASMMIPGAVTLIPAYVLMTKIGFVNTYWSLLVPGAVSAGSIFLLTQFLKSVPRELEEAALVDGASRFRIYKDVVIPLARPALLTVFILQFQGMWNAFMAPLLYLNTPRMWVLNVALTVFQQQYKAQWNLTLVAAMFNAIPVLLLFALFSRYYIEGISYAGLKG